MLPDLLSLLCLTTSLVLPRILMCPLEVEIMDDHSVSVSRVHRGCVLNMFSERYSINLVLIRDANFARGFGYPWVSNPNGAGNTRLNG